MEVDVKGLSRRLECRHPLRLEDFHELLEYEFDPPVERRGVRVPAPCLQGAREVFHDGEQGLYQPLIRVPHEVREFRLRPPFVVLEFRGFPEELVPECLRRTAGLFQLALDLLRGNRRGRVRLRDRAGRIPRLRGFLLLAAGPCLVFRHCLFVEPNISEIVRAT